MKKEQITAADSFNYYEEELKKISTSGEYAPKFKLMGGGTLDAHTNWMDVNKESAVALISWLENNVLNK